MATEEEFWGRDTPSGNIGTAVHDAAETIRAANVARKAGPIREAIRSLSNEPGCGSQFCALAQSATDDALEKLGRLIR